MTLLGITVSAAIIWLIAAGVLALIEALTQGLTSIWFAFAAAAAAVTALAGGSAALQVIVFIGVSLILLIFTRPVVKRKLNSRVEMTNVDAVTGQEGIVLEKVSHLQPGQVKADGKVWTAGCEEGETIEKGKVVIVKGVRGVTLTVEDKEKADKERNEEE